MSFHTEVGLDGSVELPAALLEQAGFKAGDVLLVDRDDRGRLVIRSRKQVLREAQDHFRSLVPEGLSLVDELIADRRAEAAQEDAEFEEWSRTRANG